MPKAEWNQFFNRVLKRFGYAQHELKRRGQVVFVILPGTPVRTNLGNGRLWFGFDFGTSPHGLSETLRKPSGNTQTYGLLSLLDRFDFVFVLVLVCLMREFRYIASIA